MAIFGGTALAEVEPLDSFFSLVTFFPGLAVTWRRLYDTGRSGWWFGGPILALIPLGALLGFLLVSIGAVDLERLELVDDMTGGRWIPLAIFAIFIIVWLIVILAFTIQNSEFGPNKYGENPKGEGNASVFD